MYGDSDKQKLYWLLDQYLLGKINEPDFCNEFHNSFVNEMDVQAFTNIEFEAFSESSDVSQRFSEYEEDFERWEGFINTEKLKQQIVNTKQKLVKQKPV